MQAVPEKVRWFVEEVQPHGPELHAYLRGRFPCLGDVDNLVQESLMRVMRAHESTPVLCPRGLLFATARNLAYDVLRRHQIIAFESMAEITDSSVLISNDDVAETVSKKQELDLLEDAIRQLPDRCRQVFTLRAVYGLSQKEVAAKLEISETTVEKQMAKGTRSCTAYFARRGVI